jgi:antibiotic biosynthesis monooxygenase (ABM) superfamily enzyme
MKTIVTHVHLKPDAGRDWDAAMRKRLSAARKRPGWVGGQLLRPADNEDKRASMNNMCNVRLAGSGGG